MKVVLEKGKSLLVPKSLSHHRHPKSKNRKGHPKENKKRWRKLKGIKRGGQMILLPREGKAPERRKKGIANQKGFTPNAPIRGIGKEEGDDR